MQIKKSVVSIFCCSFYLFIYFKTQQVNKNQFEQTSIIFRFSFPFSWKHSVLNAFIILQAWVSHDVINHCIDQEFQEAPLGLNASCARETQQNKRRLSFSSQF